MTNPEDFPAYPCVIVDIDGTLADLSHRIHHVTGGNKNYDQFYAELSNDLPFEATINLVHHLNAAGATIILASGRPDNYRADTVSWLVKHSVPYDFLYMRKAGDFRADYIIKREILDQIRADSFDPWIVIDDRPQVVDMWRSEGLTVLQAAYNDGIPNPNLTGKTLLHILVGPSGAGKSRFAADNFPARQIISSDDLRQDLLGDPTDQTNNSLVFKTLHKLVALRLKQGLPTVIDATNIRRADRIACAKLAPPGVLAEYIVIDRPLASKLRTRGWRLPSLIHKHELTFHSQLKDILRGDNLPHVTVRNRITLL